MKILLFSCPDATHPLFPRFTQGPNLGLNMLAAAVKDRAEVTVADLVLRRADVPQAIQEAMEKVRPRLVGISAMTFQYFTARKIAAAVRALDPSVQIVIGGYHASLAYRSIAEDPEAGVDFIVRGEGEETFRELVDALSGGGDVSGIRGLSYRKDGVFAHNPDRPVLALAGHPLPDRGSRLWGGYNVWGRPFDFIESSRGCTLPCSFCSITRHYGHGQRVFEIPRVIADARDAAARGTEQLFFVDDNITLDPVRFEELLDALIEAAIPGLTYSTQVSVAGLYERPALIEKMVRAGFALAYVGVENMVPRNLRYYKKGDISEKTGWVLDRLHRNGVIIMGGFIIGSPGDTREDILAQFEFMRREPIDGFLIQILTPYPGTPMSEELESAGLIVNRDLRRYSGFFANVRTNTLSSRELDFLKWKHTPYFRSPKWFLRSRAIRRYALPLLGNEGLRRVGEFFVEGLRRLFQGEEAAFLRFCEEHLNSNCFFGEKVVPSWPDDDQPRPAKP